MVSETKLTNCDNASNLFFDRTPTDWKDLEQMVQQAFAEMGYQSHRAHSLATIRGSVEVDVHAVKTSTPIPTVVLCECKYWNKPIPQVVVQSFRTVCSDAGAHFGLIISKKGFQTGANETRNSTNIHLMTFEEFQRSFFREWASGVYLMLNAMRDELLPIFRASTGIVEYGLDTVKKEMLAEINILEKYSLFFGLDSQHSNYFSFGAQFPVTFCDPRGSPKEICRISVNSHREYFEVARQGLVQCRKYFNLKPKYFSEDEAMPVWPWK
jgi:hypothetical protein